MLGDRTFMETIHLKHQGGSKISIHYHCDHHHNHPNLIPLTRAQVWSATLIKKAPQNGWQEFFDRRLLKKTDDNFMTGCQLDANPQAWFAKLNKITRQERGSSKNPRLPVRESIVLELFGSIYKKIARFVTLCSYAVCRCFILTSILFLNID